MTGAWRETGEGIELAVRVTPRGGADRIAGLVEDDAGRRWLAVRVAVPAEGGRANRALRRLLARALEVPASAVELLAGESSRRKRVLVRGRPAALEARLAALTGTAGDGQGSRRDRR
ncbi:MAG TPA: DUF167 domain-containing protein [Rhodospirillales bacterium]|nr:DUF167 domain-containing protein [Rhodospirillales bacterium]